MNLLNVLMHPCAFSVVANLHPCAFSVVAGLALVWHALDQGILLSSLPHRPLPSQFNTTSTTGLGTAT